jgi:hypothetical protein
MQHDPKVPIVGGTAHGKSIHASNDTNEVELDVHTCDNPTEDSQFTETYERREFNGEGFGEGFDCFVLKSDDETEQTELARWSISQPPMVADNG